MVVPDQLSGPKPGRPSSLVTDQDHQDRWRGPGDTDRFLKSSAETVILGGRGSRVVINGSNSEPLSREEFAGNVDNRIRRVMEQTKTGKSVGVSASDERMRELIRNLQGERISEKDSRKILVEEILGGGANPTKQTIKNQLKAAVERMKQGEKVRFVIRGHNAPVARAALKYLEQIRASKYSDQFLLRVEGAGGPKDRVSSILRNVRSRKNNPFQKINRTSIQRNRKQTQAGGNDRFNPKSTNLDIHLADLEDKLKAGGIVTLRVKTDWDLLKVYGAIDRLPPFGEMVKAVSDQIRIVADVEAGPKGELGHAADVVMRMNEIVNSRPKDALTPKFYPTERELEQADAKAVADAADEASQGESWGKRLGKLVKSVPSLFTKRSWRFRR